MQVLTRSGSIYGQCYKDQKRSYVCRVSDAVNECAKRGGDIKFRADEVTCTQPKPEPKPKPEPEIEPEPISRAEWKQFVKVLLDVSRSATTNEQTWDTLAEAVRRHSHRPPGHQFRKLLEAIANTAPPSGNRDQWQKLQTVCERLLNGEGLSENAAFYQFLSYVQGFKADYRVNTSEWRRLREVTDSLRGEEGQSDKAEPSCRGDEKLMRSSVLQKSIRSSVKPSGSIESSEAAAQEEGLRRCKKKASLDARWNGGKVTVLVAPTTDLDHGYMKFSCTYYTEWCGRARD